MFRSQQHREKAAAYGELIKRSSDQRENDELHKLRDRHSALADNEQGLADDYDSAVNATGQNRARGLALAAEEEHILRCLGAAIIMQWNALPKSMQREIFDTAASVGEVLETAALRRSPAFCTSIRIVQIARRLRRRMRMATRNRAPRRCRDGTMREAQSPTDCRGEPHFGNRRIPHVTYKKAENVCWPDEHSDEPAPHDLCGASSNAHSRRALRHFNNPKTNK